MIDRSVQPIWKSSNGSLRRLAYVPVGKETLTEDDLRDLVATHPFLLPVQSFDPVFADPVCLGTEFPVLGVGRVDALFLSPFGHLILVETKLWKNPEARREVVGQVIHYASELTRWTYSELQSRFRERGFVDRSENEPLFSYVCEGVDDESEQAFADATGRCLREGRFLLLIVGDGIREGVADMAEFLQQSPTLRYTLGLVELACYRDPARPGEMLYVPQVVTRSREIDRAVVRIALKGLDSEQVVVTADVPGEPRRDRPHREDRLSEDEFYQQLASSTSEALADQLQRFINDLRKYDALSRRFTPKSMRVDFLPGDDDSLGRPVLVFSSDGRIRTTKKWLDFLEASSPGLAEAFGDRLGTIDARLRPQRTRDGKFTVPKISNVADLAAVAPKFDQVLAVVKETFEHLSAENDGVE